MLRIALQLPYLSQSPASGLASGWPSGSHGSGSWLAQVRTAIGDVSDREGD